MVNMTHLSIGEDMKAVCDENISMADAPEYVSVETPVCGRCVKRVLREYNHVVELNMTTQHLLEEGILKIDEKAMVEHIGSVVISIPDIGMN